MSPQHASPRAIFLDIDGTYAHHGVVPDGHADAVRRARAGGHLVLLCTGRPPSLIPDHIRAAGFDGVVATAGAHVTVGDRVLVDTRFPADLARRAIEILDAHGALYFLEAPEATYAHPRAIAALDRYRPRRTDDAVADRGRQDIRDALRPVEDPHAISFGKITTLHARSPLAEIAAAVGPEVDIIPSSIPDMGPGAGEMFLSGMHKARGIEAVLAHLGLARDAVVACGDGPNDREMLAFAHVAVAIEGAHPDLIAAAHLVAAPPDRAGLVEAFAVLGLFD